EAQGGTVQDTHDGYAVTFPEEPQAEALRADAREIEAAVERAREAHIATHRLWRERGDGWYTAESRDTHPGFWWLCQIDERTGRPLGCECPASHVCWHLGGAIGEWRQRHDYETNGAAALTEWQETLDRIHRERPTVQEEQWV
ncbi:MAG: hypothetical protein KGR26_16765, partial [Cyanobacteria bacterium REEB65]|nr:hypothetical protein [Cyanobacteria bacterium REEB65]